MVEYSNIDLQASGFPLANTFDSQNRSPYNSLSLPSEPPDIKNLFSSYAYDSPVLDSSDDLRGCGSNDTECEKDEFNEKMNIKEETLGDSNSSDTVECSSIDGNAKQEEESDQGGFGTPSLNSEPPDIKNWFSSYVYESPVLDSVDDIGKIECESEGLNVEKRHKKEKNSRDVSSIATTKCTSLGGNIKQDDQSNWGSSETLAFSSEPPDVKNWFSSYAYESPVLDSIDDFEGCGTKESECEKDGFNVEKGNRKDENLGEFASIANIEYSSIDGHVNPEDQSDRDLSEMLSLNSEPLDINNLFSGYVYESPVLDSIDDFEGIEIKENECEKQGVKAEKSYRKEEHLGEFRTTRKIAKEDEYSASVTLLCEQSVKKSPCKIDRRSPEKLRRRGILLEKSSEAMARPIVENNLGTSQDNEALIKKYIYGRNEKENRGDDSAENGFASTRKNKSSRMNDENFVERPQQVKFDSGRNVGKASSAGGLKRKALSETSNFVNSDVVEIPGKWRCPQKSKPKLGPPMKQLRLEQWVRRV